MIMGRYHINGGKFVELVLDKETDELLLSEDTSEELRIEFIKFYNFKEEIYGTKMFLPGNFCAKDWRAQREESLKRRNSKENDR